MTPPLPAASQTLWVDVWEERYPALAEDREADAVVVGAGIAGLSTAALLAQAGKTVIVLEGGIIGCGTTGHTTAKISALQGLKLQKIEREHGREAARRYVEAQQAGLAWIDERVRTRDIDCGFERRTAYTYTTDPGRRESVTEEAEVGRRAGLDTEFTTDTELPFPVVGAVSLPEQAQFDPHPYLLDLAAEVAATAGCSIHEHSRVISLDHLGRHGVTTSGGHVRAGSVIVTTLLPIANRGLFFARAEPDSSYTIAVTVDGPRPEGMYLSADQPKRSLRTAQHDGEDVLVVGGGGHVVGRKSDTLREYEDLRTWADQHFAVTAVRRRWSAHDYSPIDGLPYVGRSWSPGGGPLIATGFGKWGMASGTAAAMTLADHVLGRRDGPSQRWSALFDPARLNPRGLFSAARLNGGVAARLARDWATGRGTTQPGTTDPAASSSSLSSAAASSGPASDGRNETSGTTAPVVRRRNLMPVADVRVEGRPCEVSLVCTHLGGVLHWNEAERSWDCPLHGSRFAEGGEVLTGPAVRPLSRTDPPASDGA